MAWLETTPPAIRYEHKMGRRERMNWEGRYRKKL